MVPYLVAYDAACDIFSFGIVLAELWSGGLQNCRNARGQFYNFFEDTLVKRTILIRWRMILIQLWILV
jgi:hypothetical protein